MKQIVIFGAGDFGKKACYYFGFNNIYGFVDNDPKKQGTRYLGKPVFSLDRYMKEFSHMELVVAISNYKAVLKQLAFAGFPKVLVFIDVNGEQSVIMVHNYRRMVEGGLITDAVKLEDIKQCTGCGACVNSCDRNAIYLTEDEHGFMRPVIKPKMKDKCVQCSKCVERCPVLYPEYKNTEDPDCYTVQASDQVRLLSPDGGIDFVLAKHVISENGIVFGSLWNDDFSVEIRGIDDESKLQGFNRHKYIQSSTGLTFREVLNYLKEGKKVLYFGLPCQIAGLKKFLALDYPGLITVDVICKPVVPSKLFKKYLNDIFGKPISAYEFQNKDFFWENRGSIVNKVIFKDGSVKYTDQNDSFMEVYKHCLCVGDNCFNCPFDDFPGQGDLSIGGYWSAGIHLYEWDDRKGTDVILVNSPKGKFLLQSVKKSFKLFEKISFGWLKGMSYSVINPLLSKRFLTLSGYSKFDKAVELCLKRKWDVCVISNLSEYNYGAELTYYALYKTLLNAKLEPLMAQQPFNSIKTPIHTPQLFKINPYRDFDLSPIFRTKEEMYKLNDNADTFILGSDQMWNPVLMAEWSGVSDLSYVRSEKKKIAYATSFGFENWTGNALQMAAMKNTISRFDFISTREASGARICGEVFGRKAEVCLDPVFLLDRKEYDNLIKHSELDCSGDYIFAFIFSDTMPEGCRSQSLKVLEIMQRIRDTLGIDMKLIMGGIKNPGIRIPGIEFLDYVYTEDWLKLIMNSRYVISNSFHCICFSILFHRQFMAIVHSYWGANRYKSIMDLLNIKDRIVNDIGQITGKEFLEDNIDYSDVQDIMDGHIARSRKWLLDSIKNSSEKKLMETDLIWNKLMELSYKLSKLDLQAEGQFSVKKGLNI